MTPARGSIGIVFNYGSLNEAKVSEIKVSLAVGETSIAELGRRYHVNESTIRKIRDGQTWREVSADLYRPEILESDLIKTMFGDPRFQQALIQAQHQHRMLKV